MCAAKIEGAVTVWQLANVAGIVHIHTANDWVRICAFACGSKLYLGYLGMCRVRLPHLEVLEAFQGASGEKNNSSS